MQLRWILVSIVIIPIIFTIMLFNNLFSNSERLDIQFIREEANAISIAERIEIEKRDILFIKGNGDVLFNRNNITEYDNISNEDLKKLRYFIRESGLLSINKEEFIPEQLPKQFVRYTLTMKVDNYSKRFQWIENTNEFEPSITPPLLIKLKDIIYCITKRAELYSIRCA